MVRRNWSPRGNTPVIGGDGGHRKKVSVIGAVSVSPRARRLGLYFDTRPDGFFGASEVIGFLRDMLQALVGKVIVVWDGGPNHKGPAVRLFLSRNKRLWLERLPPYAPELNPVEQVWSWLKYGAVGEFRPRRPGRVG
ncbi:MAG: transposase [Gemmataceae bacterium]|nr:transposase [Gemmataceae bacterium]